MYASFSSSSSFLSRAITPVDTLAFHAPFWIMMIVVRRRGRNLIRNQKVQVSKKTSLVEKSILFGSFLSFSSPLVWSIIQIVKDKLMTSSSHQQQAGNSDQTNDREVTSSGPSFGIFLAGAALSNIGLFLLSKSRQQLGANYSMTLEVYTNHELITGEDGERGGDGSITKTSSYMYSKIRHPMYASMLVIALGFTTTCSNRLLSCSYLVSLIAMLTYRIPREEAFLMEALNEGNSYAEYMKRTWRLIPYVF